MIHISDPNTSPSVLLITGSTRPGRLGPQIAAWVRDITQPAGLNLELVDLADWPLPMDDEPHIPQSGIYTQEHTRAWSRKIAAAQAFIFVTPQYNWGYPAPLKNALDHLYAEWGGKPAAIVSYGGHGGGKCAGQLQQVLGALKMRLVKTTAAIELSDAAIRGAAIDPGQDFAAFADNIRNAAAELTLALTPEM